MKIIFRYLTGRLRQLGIQQKDLSLILNMHPGSISHRFTGRTQWSLDEMYALLDVCRAKPEEMYLYFPDPRQVKKRRSA